MTLVVVVVVVRFRAWCTWGRRGKNSKRKTERKGFLDGEINVSQHGDEERTTETLLEHYTGVHEYSDDDNNSYGDGEEISNIVKAREAESEEQHNTSEYVEVAGTRLKK